MNFVNKVVGWLLAAIIAFMTVLISWQVFARYVAGNSLTFSEEISRFLMIWMTLLGAAYALRKGTLVAVELLPDILKGKWARIVKIVANVMAMIFYILLIKYGWEMAQSVAFQRTPATGISMFWPMLALSVGGLLMLLNAIVVVIEEIIGKEEEK